jgi:hypothetical protein
MTLFLTGSDSMAPAQGSEGRISHTDSLAFEFLPDANQVSFTLAMELTDLIKAGL